MLKKLKIIIPILIIFGFVSSLFHWRSRDFIEKNIYDIFNKNDYPDTSEKIKNILSEFEKIPVKKLPKSFRKKTKLSTKKYARMVSGMQFFKVKKRDVYRKIVGNIRIKDLIARDSFYRSKHYFSDSDLYWGIDPRILFKILELQDALTEKGFDRNKIHITYGHRHPRLNEAVGGASKSRHIVGEAVDMVIGDINKDGIYTDEDKQIVIDLCEKKIIRNFGGIGKYPGTQTVHMDVRGYRARWDKYK